MRRTRDHYVQTLLAGLIAASVTAATVPALRANIERRNAQICLSHLQALGQAAQFYTDDYDGMLVPYGIAYTTPTGTLYSARYTKLLFPYVKDPVLVTCPSDHLDRTKLNDPAHRYPTTYGINWYINRETGNYWGTPPVPYRFVKAPARTVWAADTAAIREGTWDLPAGQWEEDLQRAPTADIFFFYLPYNPMTGEKQGDGWYTPSPWSGMVIRPFARHAGRVNVCFYDGHAGSVPASQFDPKVTQWGKPGCLWDNVPG